MKITLNRTYMHTYIGNVVTIKYEQSSNRLVWVRTMDGVEKLVQRRHLTA